MADYFENVMNLDLNLGPVPPTTPAEGPEAEPSLEESAPVVRLERLRHRRWRQWPPRLEDISSALAVDFDGNGNGNGNDNDNDGNNGDNGSDNNDNGSNGNGNDNDGGRTSQVGEGSVPSEERNCEVLKTCEHKVTSLESGSVQETGNVITSEAGSFFDCNICFDLAKDPIVTCCGHLFCWSCIYQWIHIHSDAKECPVCKGEVTLKNVTPIFGRGTHTHVPEEDSDIKVPSRPSGKRVESLRQNIERTPIFPMEEMIRRLGTRFELTRDFFQLPSGEDDSESNVRASLLNSLIASRARRRERASTGSREDVVDLTRDGPEVVPPRAPALTFRRGRRSPPVRSQEMQLSVGDDRDSFSSIGARRRERASTGSREDVVDMTRDVLEVVPPMDPALTFSRGRLSPPVRPLEMQLSVGDDRDSFSSIGAVIHGETVDTTAEIDSLVSLSTSSSRRRVDGSRSSDMDSGDSRTQRRRRLN